MVLFLLLCFYTSQAQFSPGRLVVLQAGDGSSALSGYGNPIVFREFSFSGSLGYSMSLPSTGSTALVIRGSASSEGYLSLSADTNFLVAGAYLQALPNSSALNSAAASSINRGIALVDGNGVYHLAGIGASSFANGDLRAATASNSLNLWGSSSSQGTSYYGTVNNPCVVQNSKANLRAVHIFNAQLYISSQVASGSPSVIGIYAVGNGTPTSPGQTLSTVINTGNASQPGQFFFNAYNTICYVADSRNSAQGGVQKWVKSAGTWSLAYTLSTGSGGAGAFGVVADFSGTYPKVFATTSEASNNRLVAISDTGPSSTATTLATASAANTIFRGLAFSPGTQLCNPPFVQSLTHNSVQCSQDTIWPVPVVLGSPPFSYAWSGPAAFSSTLSASPAISNLGLGSYTLQVSNACGSSSAVINPSVNPSPSLQVNAPLICTGGTATLTVSGASTYTWSTGSNSSSFTISPLGSSSYTVCGTSSQSCLSNPAVCTVSLVSALLVTANNATLCQGSSALLQASGASSYLWSNGANTSSTLVSPSLSSSYTVYGSAPGCPDTASATAHVLVNSLPQPSLSLNNTVFCVNQDAVIPLMQPPGGSLSGPGVNAYSFSPLSAGSGTHVLLYVYTDLNFCTGSSSLSVEVYDCAHDAGISAKQSFPLVLNPVGEFLKLRLGGNTEALWASVFSLNGELLLRQQLDAGEEEVSCPGLAPGLYILRLESASGFSLQRFIKF